MKRLLELLIINTVYPHWLEYRNLFFGQIKLIKLFSGKVLETGCGSDPKKKLALEINPKITSYLATDASAWDEEFKEHARLSRSLGFITELLYGKAKDKNEIDVICDALSLPFEDGSFDTYYCSGVLEHVSDLEQFFKEAHRVLKIGGHIYSASPFMYREHGTPEKDYWRIAKGGFYELARTYGFKIEFIYANAFLGSTIASAINGYVIRKIFEGNIATKILMFILSPFIFLSTNLCGYLLDHIDKDDRFSPTYYVSMKKLKSKTRSNSRKGSRSKTK